MNTLSDISWRCSKQDTTVVINKTYILWCCSKQYITIWSCPKQYNGVVASNTSQFGVVPNNTMALSLKGDTDASILDGVKIVQI
jgi:hypothetical protein